MSGRSCATRCGDQMSRLLISAMRALSDRLASVAATMAGDVSEFSATSTGPAMRGILAGCFDQERFQLTTIPFSLGAHVLSCRFLFM